MANVLLGISGSVSAYRAADLARGMMKSGHVVRAVLTRSASNFVTPALFEALTGQPCLVDAFEEPERGRMAHIDWARWADLVLVAPATANLVNRLAAGVAEDMLTTLCLAATCPLAMAPAMNPAMLSHPATAASLGALQERGVAVIEPASGEVACGEEGQGKLAATEEILAAAELLLHRSMVLRGRKLLLTTGPTEEAVDDVRVFTNRSSGKMGAAIAQAALWMGAEVVVVSGPALAPLPNQAQIVRIRSADEMLQAARRHAASCDLIIGAAAVADYRPAERTQGKRRRDGSDWTIRMVPNPDIIATLAAENPQAKVVAFAAEPSPDTSIARQKLQAKGVHAVAFNDVSRPELGFGSSQNELVWIAPHAPEEASGEMSKLACAFWLLERAARL